MIKIYFKDIILGNYYKHNIKRSTINNNGYLLKGYVIIKNEKNNG
jgi:hypothetical protein